MSTLVERLDQIAKHDWRVSLLAHTSDTADEAKRTIVALEAENATLKAERDELRKLGNLSNALWREAEQDVVALTEPLQYGDMLCFTRGTIARMMEEKSALEAERDRLRQALLLVLDQVDYTSGACGLTEMVGAVLPKEIIVQARSACASEPNDDPTLVADRANL